MRTSLPANSYPDLTAAIRFGLSLFLLICIITSVAEAGTVAFPNADRPVTVSVTEAKTDMERVRGFSHQETMPTGTGMIFIFPEPNYPLFWMKSVLFRLDILFVDANFVIRDIHHNVPACPKEPCASYGSGTKIKYAIEVSGNFCKKYGVRPLQQVEYRP